MKRRHTEATTAIDWSEIHRRIEISRTSIEQGRIITPGEKKRILRERAKTLAREPKEAGAAEDYIEVVEFSLAYEKYAVQSSFVREVCPLKAITPLPCTPPFVLGIINVRGQIISVIDIKKFFDLPEKGLTDLNKVIILRAKTMEFGILADAVLGVRNVPLSELQSSLPTLTGLREQYLKGITRDRLVILDAERLLLDNSIIVHEEAEA